MSSADTDAASPSWSRAAVGELFEQPFADLLHRAHRIHREHFDPNEVQLSTLLSIKTGGCPEDCRYCPQSVHYTTGLEREKLMDPSEVRAAARRAREAGATRFCMGAAWRQPTDRNLEHVAELVAAVGAEGLETCVTLGMLKARQAARLREAGLDYYNHNIDTSPDYYGEVITTRTFDDRLETLANVREAGVKVCCGGIVGLGESRTDRAAMLAELANLPEPPESVPINQLVQVPGTPFHGLDPVDPLEFVRTVAVARVLMPRARVRLSAGREDMSDETQALCFFAGANSIFHGERLLTTDNPESAADRALFDRLGLRFAPGEASHGAPCAI